jgi:hypothetical protein
MRKIRCLGKWKRIKYLIIYELQINNVNKKCQRKKLRVKGIIRQTHWSLNDGVYRCATQRSMRQDDTYLILNNAGRAIIPALNREVTGAWLSPGIKSNSVYRHSMGSARDYPLVTIVDAEKKSMVIAILNGNQLTNRQDILYTENNGTISFKYNNKDYKYFCGETGVMIQLSGDSNLAGLYRRLD